MDNHNDPERGRESSPLDAGESPEEPQYELDHEKLQEHLRNIRSEQSLLTGALGGLAGAAIGATAWALLTVFTQREFGLMALVVGFLAGYGVRFLGKGIDPSFGILGASLAFLGCVAAKILAIAILLADAEKLPISTIIAELFTQPAIMIDAIVATFHPLDLLFYAIALYEGYQFAFYKISEEELARMVKPVTP